MSSVSLDEYEDEAPSSGEPRADDLGRFIRWVALGWAAVTLPFSWILFDEWNGGFNLLRTVLPHGVLGNFYDLQGRAILAGRLYVPKGALGAEAFVHDGHQYTYFGVFPSLIRIPILVLTHRLDGRLSALSILIAWSIAGLLAASLLWRVRVMLVGRAPLGNAEAASYGVVIAVVLGGSTLLNSAAHPWVYTEDITWASALMIGSLFSLLGVLERPSARRVAWAGAFILATVLTRGSAGVGCVIAATATAGWFLLGRAGTTQRRWWWPVLLAGWIPLAVSFSLSWIKFGVLSGYPLHDQLYFRAHLSHIPGSYFALHFVPTTVRSYIAGAGLHFSTTFPFMTLPSYPARAVGHVHLFGTEEVTTVVGSMPLLFLSSVWGVIAIVRPKPVGQARLIAIPLFGAAVTIGVILVFGFIDGRFIGDFIPFLVLATSAGVVDMWHRLLGKGRRRRVSVFVCVALVGAFSVLATVAISLTPTGWWSGRQAHHFVQAEKTVDDFFGVRLGRTVVVRGGLPNSAPLNQLVVVNDCQGFYIRPSYGLVHWLSVEGKPWAPHSLCRQLLAQRSG